MTFKMGQKIHQSSMVEVKQVSYYICGPKKSAKKHIKIKKIARVV